MINGIINVYKDAGYTSHDVVAKLRGIVKQKKIGHTGTLDPDATGVLPVCLGKATRVAGLLTDERKTYECVLLLGTVTDTQDISGTVLSQTDAAILREIDPVPAVLSFTGPQMQIPPMYSALKKDGKKLYELAREGKVIEREPRPVHFYEIRILETAMPRVRFSVTCSRGTYIRTLCHDIGEKLGCGGCMERLVRTQVGPFRLQDALHLEEIEARRAEGRLAECITPVDCLFPEMPKVFALPAGDRLLHNGNPVSADMMEPSGAYGGTDAGKYRIYDSEGRFVGIFSRRGAKLYPETMFYDERGIIS